MIIYVMGKSASGKDSIGRLLLADGELSLKPVVLYTTRPMRDGEEEGREKTEKERDAERTRKRKTGMEKHEGREKSK